jgi:hypothetical protein
MKAIVETVLVNCEEMSMSLFVHILNEINSCATKDELRGCMNMLCVMYLYLMLYFKYGFENNQMWVKESNVSTRLILVEL